MLRHAYLSAVTTTGTIDQLYGIYPCILLALCTRANVLSIINLFT